MVCAGYGSFRSRRPTCTYPRGTAQDKPNRNIPHYQQNALRAATENQYSTIHIAQELPLSTPISTVTIKMEETATPSMTAAVVKAEKPLPVFRYPTPSLEYLADTKQSDIYKSLGMDRGRKNLLVNSLCWPYPPAVGTRS